MGSIPVGVGGVPVGVGGVPVGVGGMTVGVAPGAPDPEVDPPGKLNSGDARGALDSSGKLVAPEVLRRAASFSAASVSAMAFCLSTSRRAASEF